jgi:hypothetical protein
MMDINQVGTVAVWRPEWTSAVPALAVARTRFTLPAPQ